MQQARRTAAPVFCLDAFAKDIKLTGLSELPVLGKITQVQQLKSIQRHL